MCLKHQLKMQNSKQYSIQIEYNIKNKYLKHITIFKLNKKQQLTKITNENHISISVAIFSH